MKAFALILPALLLMAACAPKKRSPLDFKYDKVIMYTFAGGIGSDMSIIDEKGHIAKSMIKQVVLDDASAHRLITRLGDKESYTDTESACFEPYLGFVYYLQGKMVAHINVCLSCEVVTSSIPVNPQKHDKFWANNDYFAGAPSESFQKFFEGLLKKYDL